MSTDIYSISKNLSDILGVYHHNITNEELQEGFETSERGFSGGGATTTGKMWITNGKIDDYIFQDEDIPEGWTRGRSRCVFNDSKKQKVFSKQRRNTSHSEETKRKISKANKGKSGIVGKDNPACRPDVRKKISESRKQSVVTPDGVFDSIGAAAKYYNVCYATINRWCEKKDGYNRSI